MSTIHTGQRLVGRDAALATTGAALAEASVGTGGVLLVTGEPGIGKSAVLAAQSRLAAAAGTRVLRGIGWQGPGAPPYWLWTQVMRGLPLDGLGDATRLLETTTPSDATEAPEARFRLFDAVGRALAGLATTTPVLVVLDDLHWADDQSLRLLEFLGRTMAAQRVLFLGAYRDGEAGALLRELAAAGPVLPLAGLDVDGVSALMAAVAGPVPSAELADAIRRRCGGNPFFVRELTRLMIAHGSWSADAEIVPDSIHETLRVRVERLSRPCLELLEVAAIAGVEVVPELLAQAVPNIEPDIGDLLDEARRARVLVTEASRFRFAHDLYRETVLARTPAGRQRQLHAGVGHALHTLSAHGADPAAVGGAARVAAHFVAAGPAATEQALHYSVLAAQEATGRLGHENAAHHYTTALNLLRDVESDTPRRVELLTSLAGAWNRAGNPHAARDAYLRAAPLARRLPDPAALAEAALGIAALGARSGTVDPACIGILEEARALLAAEDSSDARATHSRVLAALARTLRHAAPGCLDPTAAGAAQDAVRLARASGEPAALAHALLAQHDVIWAPGTAGQRLPVLLEMADAAQRAGDQDLAAEAVLLRAAALIEDGDPEGPAELAHYTRLADRLGHARGRWGALSRRATLAAVAGRVAEAEALADEALELGMAIGLPDAHGCYGTLRGALTAIGGTSVAITELMPAADPLWPIFPLLKAWTLVLSGNLDTARETMHGFSVQSVPAKHDLEMVSVTATVFAAVGTDAQRAWCYDTFVPHTGRHAVVGGCASYHGVVDHYLGVLATALGRAEVASKHFTDAIAHYERLGASAWAQLSSAELARLRPESAAAGDGDTFQLEDGMWRLRFGEREVWLPDAKGLRDLATLLASPDRPVHVFTLLGREDPPAGADPVLDRRAVAEFRSRLGELDTEIDEAERWRDEHRARRARAERTALLTQLRVASGLGGRARRLGDDTERARKTVSARIRDALRRIDRVHPALAGHFKTTMHTGTHCSYNPDHPRHWRL
jgi:tetratricopeptide (TPR) repeat protein